MCVKSKQIVACLPMGITLRLNITVCNSMYDVATYVGTELQVTYVHVINTGYSWSV